MNSINLINLCLLGEKSTGKTVFSKTLSNRDLKSITKTHPTISDTYYSLSNIYKEKEYKINLIDTVGSDFIYEDTISKCTAFIIMFRFNDVESFNNIPMYIKMIRNSNKISSPIIIVGNKYNYDQSTKSTINFKKELKSYGLPYIFINSCCEYKQVLNSFELLLKTWKLKYDVADFSIENELYQTLLQSKKNILNFFDKLLK